MKSKIFNKYILIFVLFFIGGLIGFLHENIFGYLTGNFELRRGVIYEPIIPVYGIGLVLFFLVYSNINTEKYNKIVEMLIIFLIGFFIGGLTEYFCSFFQEKIFGTTSWDYSDLKYDINGRTSLFHSVAWGIMSLIFYAFILPPLKKLEKYLKNKTVNIILFIISIITIFDCSISFIATTRRNERRNNIEPKNIVDRFLDKYYPDKLIDDVYSNAVPVKKEKK